MKHKSRKYSSMSTVDDSAAAGRDTRLARIRPVLQESASNAQHHGAGLPLGPLATVSPFSGDSHDLDGLALPSMLAPPPLPMLLTPPILPSNTGNRRLHHPSVFARLPIGEGDVATTLPTSGDDENPLKESLQFRDYRSRQLAKNKKDNQKDDQKWPDVLEDAFLDACLLIPQIGRSKFSIGAKQPKLHGRNMLIGIYVWLAYLKTLPAEEAARLPLDPPHEEAVSKAREARERERGVGFKEGDVHDYFPNRSHPMARSRKQISSHMQVLKDFYRHHPCYHIFFPPTETNQGAEHEPRDKTASAWLNNHVVLQALAKYELPHVRPNKEYFTWLLRRENHIVIKPTRCWIFLQHPKFVMLRDGSAHNPQTGELLQKERYRCLERNVELERSFGDSDKLSATAQEKAAMGKGLLLHDFTRKLEQGESNSLRRLRESWEVEFPALHERLEAAIATEKPVDIVHLRVTLDTNSSNGLCPAGSDLKCWVETAVTQPHLLGHTWEVRTAMVRPEELHYDTSFQEVGTPRIEHKKAEYEEGAGGVMFLKKEAETVLGLPFPADFMASTIQLCQRYPVHPARKTDGANTKATMSERRHLGAESDKSTVRVGQDEEADLATGSASYRRDGRPGPTQMDLVRKLAMMHELFSCAPDAHHEGVWERRAVMLWSFESIYSMDSKGKPVKAKPKTTWRFLSLVDPTSERHYERSILPGRPQRRAYTHGVSAQLPAPAYHDARTAGLGAGYGAAMDAGPAWDSTCQVSVPIRSSSATYPLHLQQQLTPGPGGLSILGGYPVQQAPRQSEYGTPPPSAPLATSFGTHSFDSVSGGTSASDIGHLDSSFATTGTDDLDDPVGLGGNYSGDVYHESHGLPSMWPDAAGPVDSDTWTTATSQVVAPTQHDSTHHAAHYNAQHSYRRHLSPVQHPVPFPHSQADPHPYPHPHPHQPSYWRIANRDLWAAASTHARSYHHASGASTSTPVHPSPWADDSPGEHETTNSGSWDIVPPSDGELSRGWVDVNHLPRFLDERYRLGCPMKPEALTLTKRSREESGDEFEARQTASRRSKKRRLMGLDGE